MSDLARGYRELRHSGVSHEKAMVELRGRTGLDLETLRAALRRAGAFEGSPPLRPAPRASLEAREVAEREAAYEQARARRQLRRRAHRKFDVW